MTIRSRNRFNNILFYVSLAFLLVNTGFFVFATLKSNLLDLPSFFEGFSVRKLFFGYNRLVVFASLFFMNLYVVVVSRGMNHAFEKTQCTEISFFFCFLIACLAECSRFYIPVFAFENSFSSVLVFLGNVSAFARLAAPFSILAGVIMSGIEQRQNVERNMSMILILAVFIATILPMNTSVIEPNFRVHAGFDKIVVTIEVFIDTLAAITLFIYNLRDGNNQKTFFGLVLIIAGFVLNINSTNLFKFILSTVFFSAGSILYLKELHDRHLYD